MMKFVLLLIKLHIMMSLIVLIITSQLEVSLLLATQYFLP